MKQQMAMKKQTDRKNTGQRGAKTQLSARARDSLPQLQRTLGNHGVLRRYPGVVQAKLTIGQPNDRYEQEADRMADLVMRMSEPEMWRAPT
jgi:hypothetical protein